MEYRPGPFSDPIEAMIEESSFKEWLERIKAQYRRHYYSMVADADNELEKWFSERPNLSQREIDREKERHKQSMMELQANVWAERDEEIKMERERRIIGFNLRDGGVDAAFVAEQQKILNSIANTRAQEQEAAQKTPRRGKGGNARTGDGRDQSRPAGTRVRFANNEAQTAKGSKSKGQQQVRPETRDEVIARFHQRVQGIIDNMRDDLAVYDADRFNYDTNHSFYTY